MNTYVIFGGGRHSDTLAQLFAIHACMPADSDMCLQIAMSLGTEAGNDAADNGKILYIYCSL